MNGNDWGFVLVLFGLICAVGGWVVIELVLYLLSFVSITIG